MQRLFCLPAVAALLGMAALSQAQIPPPSEHFSGPLGHGKVTDPQTGIVYDVDALRAANLKKANEANRLLQQAEALLRKKDVAQALPLLKQSLLLAPDDERTRARLADIYGVQKRPDGVLQTLRPLLYPPPNTARSVGIELRMKYVLALLDTGKWEDAVTLYEQSLLAHRKDTGKPLMWSIFWYGAGNHGQDHTLPETHFRSDVYEEAKLRAQAHLILGTRQPQNPLTGYDEPEIRAGMLDHLQQVLQYDRRSLDALFVTAVLIGSLNRFDEARAGFARLAKIAPQEAQAEINDAVSRLNLREETRKAYKAHPARAGKTGYYEATYTDETGKEILQDKAGPLLTNRSAPRLITTTCLWHPAWDEEEPPECVILTREELPDPANLGKPVTSYEVRRNPGLRFVITFRGYIH